MEIRSLLKVTQEDLYIAFQKAFKDYEMQLTQTELLKMLKRRGFVPELSFGAFSGGKLVSFTFNGTGRFNGLSSAYDTGTGTVEEFRGQGLATRIFEYSLPHLKRAGISQYILEVLQHNEGAVSLYRKLGFRVSREFNYFLEKKNKIHKTGESIGSLYRIRQTDLKEKNRMRTFWDHQPSWQNSFEAVERSPENFQILGAYLEENLAGYCIFEPESGDITQLAVDPELRKRGIASLLMKKALQSINSDTVKAINYETELTAFDALMKSFGINRKGKQYEMIKKLD